MMRSGGFCLQHGADLHRARMRAQHWPRAVGRFREIERVVILPRRMLGRNVERGEIVEVGLDVRAFGDREAHIGEDLGDLVGDLAHGMDAPLGERPFAHRQRDVGALCRELARAAPHWPSASRLASSAAPTPVLEAVDRLAEALALSGGSGPSLCISSETRPFLPSAAMRTSSSAPRSAALGDGVKQLALEPVELQRAR